MDFRASPERIATVIRECKADILATQEITYSQAETVGGHIGCPFIFGAARQHQSEPYGNAVFSHFRVVSHENYDLTVNRREPRQCLRVSLALPDSQNLHFFAVHLGTAFLERREQARRLLSSGVLERPDVTGARILAGDFNEWTRGLATRMLGRHLQSADISMHLKRSRTYPGALPFLHLDHIYYDTAFLVQNMHLHRTRLAVLASDHLPLIAEFETAGSTP
jgi:endonuclease/exonuclease/phosphatase family metal-dependent hydrolase